ncbi:MAG TPA: AraC family transcriptional regulator [Chryseosolibacter sp.]
MPNHLKLYSTLSVFFGRNLKTKAHAHHAMEIVLAVNGSLTIHSGKTIKAEGVILKPDIIHSISGTGLIISILLDPETALCNHVISMLGSKSVLKLEPSITDMLVNHFKNHTNRHFSEDGICELLSNSLASSNSVALGNHIDPRVLTVIDLIKTSPQKSLPFTTLIRASGVSESRLMHLFKKETGTTIRKYVLWNKLQHAIKLHLVGNSLKQAAKQSGFTDPAHFNRVFVSNYGANPSSMLK